MKTRPFTILAVAGEASGDHHGAPVIRSLKTRWPDLQVRGVGGDEMQQAGMHIDHHCRDMAVVGLLEVLPRATHILRVYRQLRQRLRTDPPDLLLLIDYAEFNMRMARLAHRCGVPVLYYISPQLWAWRRGRARKLARWVDRMAVIFPFEVDFYRRVGLQAECVGHPLLDHPIPALDMACARAQLKLDANHPVIGLVPGSRSKEIETLLPDMLGAARQLHARYPQARFVLPVAPDITDAQIEPQVTAADLPITTTRGRFYETLQACDLVLIASGTATLQAALTATPMIILYRVAPLTYAVGRLLIKIPWIGLANIVAGDRVVPELIQHQVRPDTIAAEAHALLDNDRYLHAVITRLRETRDKLGTPGAAQRVAEIAADMLDPQRHDT